MAPQDETETLQLFRDSVRRFLAEEYAPNLDEWRRVGAVDRAFFRRAGAQGLLCPSLPEAYGGGGGDLRHNLVVVEEVARLGVAPSSFAVHSDICANYILRWGSDSQKSELLPRMASGEILAAIAMTEPQTGSDLQAISTRADPVEGGYRLSGSKTFITNGQNCDLVIVVAKSDPQAGARGLTLFLTDATAAGFRKGRNLKKLGGHEQDTSEIFLDEVYVPLGMRLGEEGQGFAILMSELVTERLTLSVAAVTAAETAIDLTVDYVHTRHAFGQPLIAFQNTGFKLAECRANTRMARAFAEQCVSRALTGALSAVDAAELKLATTAIQCQVVDECLQLHGGYGWMDEFPISRMYADARVQRIYGGSDEVMKIIIARDLSAQRR